MVFHRRRMYISPRTEAARVSAPPIPTIRHGLTVPPIGATGFPNWAGYDGALCGTFTTPLTINGSGRSGNVIEILWDTGTRISVPDNQIINLNGNNGYLLFDGGIACGQGTPCDSIEAANNNTYVPGQTGIIEATANGSQLPNQNVTTQAFYNCSGCHDIEIRNLIVRNLYVHSLFSDQTSSADTGNFTFQCSGGLSGCAAGSDLRFSDHAEFIVMGTRSAFKKRVRLRSTYSTLTSITTTGPWRIAATGLVQ